MELVDTRYSFFLCVYLYKKAMIDINQYITQVLEDRQMYIDLTEECIERGGNSTIHKGVLAIFLGTTIPSGYRILLCHKCNNPKCSNPKHLYFGTPKENVTDSKNNGTWISVWDRMVSKYGYEGACKINSKGNKAAGGKANKGKPKSEEHKKRISDALKAKKPR